MDKNIVIGLGVLGLLAVLFWPSGSSQKVKDIYTEGEQFLAAKKYPDAIQKYQAALVEAEKPFVKTEVIDKDFKSLANYKIAFCYTQIADQSGDITKYDEAIKIVEPLYQTATVPKHRELITFLWGYVLFKQNKYEEAEPKFQEVIENYPNSLYLENAWYSIAQLNFKLANYDKARSAYKKIVDGFPNSDFRDDAQHLIAQSFLIEKNYEQAFREFDYLNAANFPTQQQLIPEAQYKAAFCLKELQRFEEGVDRYNRFIASFPESGYVTAAYFDLGTIYTRQKDYDNAIQNYRLAIDNTDDMALKAEIQYEIGDNYMEAKDYQNAAESYKLVVESYPESQFVPAARFGIAESTMKLAQGNTTRDKADVENFTKAIAAYQDVLNEHPGSEYEPHATFQIAEAYYQAKAPKNPQTGKESDLTHYERAVEWYDKVMEKFPENELAPYALYGALWSLSELDRTDEVLARGRAFIEKNAKDPEFDLQAAEIQMKLGDIMFEKKADYAVAAEEYGKAIAYPDLPKFYAVRLRCLFQQGLAYYKLGEQSGDKANFQKATVPFATAIAKYSDDAFNLDYEFPERKELLENAVLNKALAHEKLEEWAKVREAYALIERLSPNYGRAQVLIAESYEKEKNLNEAINRYKAIANDNSLGETWQSLGAIRQADLLRNAERYAEAAEAYAAVADKYPKSDYVDAARYLVGLCYYSVEPKTEDNLKKSIDGFNIVVTQFGESPNAPDALYGMVLSAKALAEMGKGQWADVITYADQLSTKYGTSEDARAQKAVNGGNLMKIIALEKMGTGDKDEMVRRLRELVDSSSADESARATAQLKIGNILFEQERYADAMPEYARLAELFPQNEYAALAYYQAAVCAYKIAEAEKTTNEAGAQRSFTTAADYAGKALAATTDKSLQLSIQYTRGLALGKTDKYPEAIEALKQVVALQAETNDPQKEQVVSASRIELARLYGETGKYQDAVKEYNAIASSAQDNDTKSRAYLSMAQLYEENIKDGLQAANYFLQGSSLTANPVLAAQSLYRAGVLYEEAKRPADAAKAFETLRDKFSDNQDSNVQLMVADAGVRISDVYVKSGKLTEAIAIAEKARDNVAKDGSQQQKVQANYQVANLRAQFARTRFDERPTATNEEYKRLSRQAIREFLDAAQMGLPIERASENTRLLVGFSYLQAGQIGYALHGPQDLPIAIDASEKFLDLQSKGTVKVEPDDLKNTLFSLGVAYYDWGRGNKNDPAMFAKSAQTLARLVRQFPRDKDAGLWQYQVGEAYFTAGDFQKALQAYLATAENYPRHEKAADALYSAAACYAQLGQNAQVNRMYERIVTDYPNSEYAAEALLNTGNARYNDAAPLADNLKIPKLRQALDFYRRAQAHKSANAKIKADADGFIQETSELLGSLEYTPLEQEQARAFKAPNKPMALRAVIQKFEQLIKDYPTSSTAAIAMTKIGDCYTELEDYKNALDAYNRLMLKYTDKNGRRVTPQNEYIGRALKYAEQQFIEIKAYQSGTAAQGRR